VSGTSLHDTAPWSGESFGLTLLTPTVIYVRDCMKMVGAADIRGLVHMTGGGFPENIPRVVPKGLAARIRRSAWEVPQLFQWIQEVGRQRGMSPHVPPQACPVT
jgi:phosphoribosylformylglycinamidine cyclo-ligase